MRKVPRCNKCKEVMFFDSPARIGSFHSNYYKCPKCGKVVEIRDCDLEEGFYDV